MRVHRAPASRPCPKYWAARWCESYNDDRPVAHRWDASDEWVALPFPDDVTLVRDMTRGEGSKRKWTCAVCSGSETCVILWDESGSRSFVLPLEPRAYVFVPNGASCRVGRWAAAHASDAAEGAHMPPNQCSSPFLIRTAIPGAVTYSSLTRTSLTLSRDSNSVMALCGPHMVQPFGLWNPTCLEKT